MAWSLKQLVEHCGSCAAQINGKWVPARPPDGPFAWRLRDAWLVLKGKADAFTWPEGQ